MRILIVAAAVEDAACSTYSVGSELVAITTTRSPARTPVAPVQSAKFVDEAVIAVVGMVQYPVTMPEIVLFPPTTKAEVEASIETARYVDVAWVVVAIVAVTPCKLETPETLKTLATVVLPVTARLPVMVEFPVTASVPERVEFPVTVSVPSAEIFVPMVVAKTEKAITEDILTYARTHHDASSFDALRYLNLHTNPAKAGNDVTNKRAYSFCS